jgi:hypothetical protein
MFTPTPSSPALHTHNAAHGSDGWQLVELEVVDGARGKAAILWLAQEKPLRMTWRVGPRTFRDVESARAYARSIVDEAN